MTGNINDANTINYVYRFTFKDGVKKEFKISLGARDLNYINPRKESPYPWTELKYHKCPICPLDDNSCRFCPVAVNLADVIDFFKTSVSHEEIEVLVQSDERTYLKNAPLQYGLSSLIGIYMVTSGCPIMAKLQPMVRFHLPFASMEETAYRMISMYLSAQYFCHRKGGKPDWDLKNLKKIYEDVRVVDKSFCSRLLDITTRDAGVNAFVILDTAANYINMTLEEMLDSLEGMFGSYYAR